MNGAVLAGFELSWIFYRFGFFRLSILSIFRLSIWVFPFIDFIDFRLSIWVFSFIDFIDFRLSISVFSFIDFIDFRLSFSIFKSIMHFQCNIPESRFPPLNGGTKKLCLCCLDRPPSIDAFSPPKHGFRQGCQTFFTHS